MYLVYYSNYGIFNFIIGATSVKIEHDHCAWERSLNPSSTASTVDFGLIPLHPTTTTTFTPTPEPARNCGQRPTRAPPLFRGMWADSNLLDRGGQEGGTRGGTHAMGGPHGASQKRATTFVVAHSPSSFSATHHPSSQCQASEPRQRPKTPARQRTSTLQLCERPNDRTSGPTTTPNDRTSGPTTARQAQRRHEGPNDPTLDPTTTDRKSVV